MNFNEYQSEARKTAIYPPEAKTIYPALGLVSEAGEVAGKIKKYIRDGHELDEEAVMHELGDVLWYVAALAHDLGYDLQTVAAYNINKLKSRQDRGALSGSGDYR
jgi:NTP pyrophosphatase (non-canonical NTP hydrolase)